MCKNYEARGMIYIGVCAHYCIQRMHTYRHRQLASVPVALVLATVSLEADIAAANTRLWT